MKIIKKDLTKNLTIIFFIFYVIFLFVFFYFKIGETYYHNILNYLNFLNHIIALFFGYSAINYFKLSNKQGKIAFFISLSVLMWLIGEIIWQFNNNAIISIADFFYLLGYPFMMISIFLAITISDNHFISNKKQLFFLFFGIILITILYFKISPINWQKEISFLENLVTSGYVIADFILLIPCFALILVFWKGEYKKAWIYLLIGVFFIIIGDTYYAINYETYEKGSLFDLTWFYGYLFFSLALYTMKQKAQESLDFLKEKLSKDK
ncbi:MAG: hypothetical protein QXM96_00785 [Candidatus Woesearchaeota archaeon]